MRTSQANPIVDFNMRTVSYEGVTVSFDLFSHFADQANEGTLFRFIKNDNGNIAIEQLAKQEEVGGR